MIIHRNAGLIDLRGIRTFGLSAKPETDKPLGFFGSGLKHGLAVLLRTGHQVTLYRGRDRHTFATRQVKMRDKNFDVVMLDDEELAFSTDLGPHWTVDMAFREFHSNTLDENGTTLRANECGPVEGETIFAITGNEYEGSYNRRDTIFLSTPPILSIDNVNVHRGTSEYAYYRGVQVYKLPKPSLYTYNLTHLTWGLTEDRTLKDSSDLALKVADVIASVNDESFLRDVMLADETRYESTIGSWTAYDPGEAFVTVYRALRQEGRAIQLTSIANATYLRKHTTLPLPEPISLTRMQQMQLDKAITFCKKAGWTVDEYPVVVVPHAHGGLLALAVDNKIVLTVRVFEMGIAEIVNTLFEEWTHLKMGLKDMTREMQTHLMRQLVCAKQELLEEVL